jgi:hypothetical protein
MINNENEFGKLHEIELNVFENVNGIKLPIDYRDFLLKFNGGSPYPDNNANPSTVATYILGMHNGDFYASLHKHINIYNKRLPLSTLPITTIIRSWTSILQKLDLLIKFTESRAAVKCIANRTIILLLIRVNESPYRDKPFGIK